MYKINEIIDKVHCADCLIFMKQMPDECVDLAFIDPDLPWDKDGYMIPKQRDDFIKILIEQMKRVLKPDGEFYVNTDHRTYTMFFPILNEKFVIKIDCIGWNYDIRSICHMSRGFVTLSDEYLIYGVKTSTQKFDDRHKKLFWVLSYSQLQKEERGLHGSQKPLELMNKILIDSSKENDVILDPTLGSGTMALAAKRLHRHFIGIDISKDHCETAKRRLQHE